MFTSPTKHVMSCGTCILSYQLAGHARCGVVSGTRGEPPDQRYFCASWKSLNSFKTVKDYIESADEIEATPPSSPRLGSRSSFETVVLSDKITGFDHEI